VKDKALGDRLIESSQALPRFGYRRTAAWLEVGLCRVRRLWKQLGLQLPRRRRCGTDIRLPGATHPNSVWCYDFVHDRFADGRAFRLLCVLDEHTRECLAIEVGQSLKGENAVAVLHRIAMQRGVPKTIFCDNGSEFVGRALDLWAYVNKVRIDFSRPGKPTDNAHVESFNGRLREECQNSHLFVSMQDAKRVIEAWRTDYNESRPHRALGNCTPKEFALAAGTCAGDKSDGMPETLNQSGTNSG